MTTSSYRAARAMTIPSALAAALGRLPTAARRWLERQKAQRFPKVRACRGCGDDCCFDEEDGHDLCPTCAGGPARGGAVH